LRRPQRLRTQVSLPTRMLVAHLLCTVRSVTAMGSWSMTEIACGVAHGLVLPPPEGVSHDSQSGSFSVVFRSIHTQGPYSGLVKV